MLSDEDIKLICVGGTADAIEGRATSPMIGALNDAYALGVERARRVKPLVWAKRAHYDEALDRYTAGFIRGEEKNFHASHMGDTIGFFDTIDEAKAACQKRHDEFVLSQLEPA